MIHQKNKIVYFNAHKKDTVLWQRNEKENRYRCELAGDRLNGFCEILIYDRYQNCAELFLLYFSAEGLKEHQYLDREEAELWMQQRERMTIPYQCAIILLGDAVRQNYKYQTHAAWSKSRESLHEQQIWRKEYCIDNHNLNYFIQSLNQEQFVEMYLNAISNKDAALLYDMQAVNRKRHVSRELYVYSWNHALEELTIFDFTMLCAEQIERKSWDVYLTVYGSYQDADILSVDLCLKLTRENGCIHLLYEQVLDACHVSSC